MSKEEAAGAAPLGYDACIKSRPLIFGFFHHPNVRLGRSDPFTSLVHPISTIPSAGI